MTDVLIPAPAKAAPKTARFQRLFAEAERLTRVAKEQSNWAAYHQALAVLDEIDGVLPLEIDKAADVAVTLSATDGAYFSAARLVKKTAKRPLASKGRDGGTVVSIPHPILRYVLDDLRYRIVHNLGCDHPDAGVRKTHAKRACALAAKIIAWFQKGGAPWLAAHRDRYVLSCNEIAWYAVEHATTRPALERALKYGALGMRQVADDFTEDGAYIRDTMVRLLAKLGAREAAYEIVRDTLAKNPAFPVQDVANDPGYLAWLARPENVPRALVAELDGEKFAADGAIESRKFHGVWNTFDAKGRVRIEVDLTGEPCDDPARLGHYLTNALYARHLPRYDVREVRGASKIEWEKLGAPALLPLHLKALASREPLLRRRGLWELSQAIGSDQGHISEATPRALPFLLALLAGESADRAGRDFVLRLLATVAENVSTLSQVDEITRATAKALKKILPGLKRLVANRPPSEQTKFRAIIRTVDDASTGRP